MAAMKRDVDIRLFSSRKKGFLRSSVCRLFYVERGKFILVALVFISFYESGENYFII